MIRVYKIIQEKDLFFKEATIGTNITKIHPFHTYVKENLTKTFECKLTLVVGT